ncbi:MAG: T9SS type A sorting domain-containing protein [bacterium]
MFVHLRKFFIIAFVLVTGVSAQAQTTLIHYFSFNSLTKAFNNPGIPPIAADVSVLDITKVNAVYWLTATNQNYAGFIDNNVGDTTNARNGFVAGNSLRFRNPSDSAELRMYIPSTNYKNLVLKWAVQTSSAASGQKIQLFDYSVDSGLTWKTSGLSIPSQDVSTFVTTFGLITVAITDTLAFNNPKFIFRIKFSGNASGASGNNRFDNFSVEGTFVAPVSNVPLSLIHYWNFNNLLTAYRNPGVPAMTPDFTVQDTVKSKLAYTLYPGTSSNYAGFIDNNAGDLTNARNSNIAGQSLRFRNPSDSAELRLIIPTTNYKNIVVKYALQSSSAASGQKTQLFDYSTDGGLTWKTSGLSIASLDVTQSSFQGSNWGLVIVNLNDTTVNNNWDLVFRIRFSGNTTGGSGNNRFDNITVEGTFVPPLTGSYAITSPTAGQTLTVGKHAAISLTPTGSVGLSRTFEYTTDRGLTWRMIGNTQGTTFDWIVPNTPSINCYVRVVDERVNYAVAGPFTIFYPGPGVITVTKPAKGDSVYNENLTTISFNVSGVVSETRFVDYSYDGGSSWYPLGSVSLGTSFDWTVPSVVNSALGRIRVRDTVGVIGMSELFNIGPLPKKTKTVVIHYWTFDNVVNDTLTDANPTFPIFHPDYSAISTATARLNLYLTPGLLPKSQLRYIDPVAGTDSNRRPFVPTVLNQGLRLRNPLDSTEMRFSIPTTGYSKIKIKYALESSSTASGDSTNIFDYSIDGGLTWINGKRAGMMVNGSNVDTLDTTPLVYQGTSWGVVSIDLSADPSVENNPNLVFRIRFKGNTSLNKGNNRFDNFTVEGDQSAGDQLNLVHYWNFDNVVNDTVTAAHGIRDIFADYSLLDKSQARISYYTLPGTSSSVLRYIDPVAPGADSNKRSVVAPGAVNNGLRLRNPLDSMELRCFIPTTGYTGIIVKYALESSSTASGDSTNIFDYSVDGGTSWKSGRANGMKVNGAAVDTLDTTPLVYQGTSWGMVKVDLSSDKAVENNPKLVFRIRFKGNTSLTKGNNRLDNFTVEGIGAAGSGPAPSITVLTPVAKDTLVAKSHKAITFFPQGTLSARKKIEFSGDSGKTWMTLGNVTTESTSFDWTVPDTNLGKCYVKVSDTTGVNGKSALFAIAQPGTVLSISVGTTPGTVKPGDSALIAWTTTGYLGATVNIDLSLDSQKTWTPIKAALAFKSKYNFGWQAPTGTHLGARIRLMFASGATGISGAFDIKDATVSVAQESIIATPILIPNPARTHAAIEYGLGESSIVTCRIYDITGREIVQIGSDVLLSPGQHSIAIDASRIPEGSYTYVLSAGNRIARGKMIVVH